ncbi:hypothetical protein NFI96_000211, partial [Prochilodus magdalenae]
MQGLTEQHELISDHSTTWLAIRVFRGFHRKTRRKSASCFSLARRVSIYLDRSKQGGAGMVVDWEQETGLLMTSGDVRVIRIWDTEREMKVQDIPTGADSCVTSLSCDPKRSLVVAGLGDGSVRVYDRRMAPNECRVMTYREHGAWVVKAHLQRETDGHIISV